MDQERRSAHLARPTHQRAIKPWPLRCWRFPAASHRDDFIVDSEAGTATCPAGHTVVDHVRTEMLCLELVCQAASESDSQSLCSPRSGLLSLPPVRLNKAQEGRCSWNRTEGGYMRGEALGHFSPAFGDACMAWEGGGRTPGQALSGPGCFTRIEQNCPNCQTMVLLLEPPTLTVCGGCDTEIPVPGKTRPLTRNRPDPTAQPVIPGENTTHPQLDGRTCRKDEATPVR